MEASSDEVDDPDVDLDEAAETVDEPEAHDLEEPGDAKYSRS